MAPNPVAWLWVPAVNAALSASCAAGIARSFHIAQARWRGLTLPLPPVGSGWFEVIYLDDEIRLARDVRGDLQARIRSDLHHAHHDIVIIRSSYSSRGHALIAYRCCDVASSAQGYWDLRAKQRPTTVQRSNRTTTTTSTVAAERTSAKARSAAVAASATASLLRRDCYPIY